MTVRTIAITFTIFCLSCSAIAAPIGIYWTDASVGTVNRADIDGSNTETLVSGLVDASDTIPPLGGLFVTDGAIYWTDRNDRAVWRSGVDGSGASILINAPGSPRDVFVTDDSVYWVSTGALDSVSVANLNGGNVTALVTNDLSFPNGISLYDDMIYWSDSGTRSIKRSDLTGANIVSLVVDLPLTQLPGAVFVTDEYLYWTTRDLALTHGGMAEPGTIQRSNLDGTGITTLVDNLEFPQHVAATMDYLYWTDQDTGKIQRSRLDGTDQTDIIVGLTLPVGLAVVAPVSVPEPATIILMGLGLAGLGFARRRRLNA